MPLTAEAMRKWAKGQAANAEPEDELDEDLDLDLPGEGEAERNPLWAGELAAEEIDEETAEDFLGWLEENEPEIYEGFMRFTEALIAEDPMAAEEAMEAIHAATQYLNPEYPPLDEAAREKASENIAKHMRDKGKPPKGSKAWKQAVAIGMSEARKAEGG